jgi:hypothetical protein
MGAAQTVTATFTVIPPPNTKITKSKIRRKKHRARFSFKAIGTATGFQCALVKAPKPGHAKPKPKYKSCSSPKLYKHLKPGKYTLYVRAFNVNGPDPTPAVKKFKIPRH